MTRDGSANEARAAAVPRKQPGGRPPGVSTTRDRILRAARARFTARGYAGTTMRAVAADAGVDSALVHHYFGTKEGLFAAVMDVRVRPREILAGLVAEGVDGLGERLALAFLTTWDEQGPESGIVSMIGSAATHEASAELLRGFVQREILGQLAGVIPTADARRRAALVGSQVIGLAVARYVIKVQPLASTPRRELAAVVGPNLQRYLTGDLPPPGGGGDG